MFGVEKIFHFFGKAERREYLHFELPKVTFDVHTIFSQPTVQLYQGQQTYKPLKRNSIISKTKCQSYTEKLEEELEKSRNNEVNYVVVDSSAVFTHDELKQIKRIHNAIEEKALVKEEEVWFRNRAFPKAEGLRQLPMDLIERFQESLFRRPPYSQIEELDNILLDDAVTITCNRWLGFQVIKNIVDLLRKQPNNLNILIAQQIPCKAKIEDEKRGSLKSAIDPTKNYIAILCNVRNNERYETAIRQDAFGNHWSIVLMDTSERTLIYCDSLSKKVPYNLKDFVNPVLQVLSLSYSQFSVQSAHHVLISGQHFHQCTGKCTGYPFQDDGNSCGIIATVCLAVLALGSKENFDYLTKPGIGRKHSLTCWVNNPTQYSKFLRFVLITWMEEKHIDLKVISWLRETGSAESIQSQIPALHEVNRSAESAELWTTAGKKTQHQSANHEIAGHEEESHSGRTVEPKIPAGLVEDSGSADTADPQALAGQKEEPPSCVAVTASTPAGDEEKPRSFEAVEPVIPAGKEKEKWPSDAVDLSAFDDQEEEPQSPEAVETSVPIDQEEEPRYLESAEPCTTTGEEEENWSPEAVQTSTPADQGKEPQYPEFLEPLIPADQKEDHQSPEAVEPSTPASQEEEPWSSENVEVCTPAGQEAKHLSTEGAEPWTPAGQEAEAVPLSSDVSSHKDGQCCSRQVPILKRKLSKREEKELTFSKRRKKNYQETKRSSKKKTSKKGGKKPTVLSFGVRRQHLRKLSVACNADFFSRVAEHLSDDCTVKTTGKKIQESIAMAAKKIEEKKEAGAKFLPLNASPAFYENQGRLSKINKARTERRSEHTGPLATDYTWITLGKKAETIAENLEQLMEKVSTCQKPAQTSHLNAVVGVARALQLFPIIETQEAGKILRKAKYGSTAVQTKTKAKSSEIYEMLSVHLNIVQVYLNGKAYLLENKGGRLQAVVQRLHNMCQDIDVQKIFNEHVKEKITDIYQDCYDYLDSKRDKDVLQFLMSSITSIKFTTELKGVKNKASIRTSRLNVNCNLRLFKELKTSLQHKYSDLPDRIKQNLIRRRLEVVKLEKLRHTYKGTRGRKLKCEEFPDLAAVLEFEFSEGDRMKRGGGGVESHPKLKTDVLYKAEDSKTRMKDARESILALAPANFKISLSSCYNYTMNFKKGTYQAKRHHGNMDVNAKISLHRPPDVKPLKQQVVNLHWSSANVNFLVDHAAANPDLFMVDSKDAKAKIRSGKKLGGKLWTQRETYDHDYQDHSQDNAVTPMSHLFLETVVTHRTVSPITMPLNLEEIGITVPNHQQEVLLTVKRTGQAVTLLYLSYYHHETVFRLFNELFYLMSIPSLDKFFQKDDGKLKENFVFVVDNGQSEKPCSPIVKMCLKHLVSFLNLGSATQVSFAEYHSKRNFGERVHAETNKGLQKQGVIGTLSCPPAGSREHRSRMEELRNEVTAAIKQATFGGVPIFTFNGIEDEDFVFKDEEMLKTFLSLSEERKLVYDNTYAVEKNDIVNVLSNIYHVDRDFSSSYKEDYEALSNTKYNGILTTWADKYTTTVYNEEKDIEIFNKQPVPDLTRWLSSKGELHYLSYESRQNLQAGPWDTVSNLFLPSRILKNVYAVSQDPPSDLMSAIALLAWCSIHDLKEFFKERAEKVKEDFKKSQEKALISQLQLYKENTKESLALMCSQEKLKCDGPKHMLVRRLVEHRKQDLPKIDTYMGDLSSLPTTVTKIMKLPAARLKEVVHFHGYSMLEPKEILALRVLQLRSAEAHLIGRRDVESLLEQIDVMHILVTTEQSLYLSTPEFVYREWTFASGKEVGGPRDQAGKITHQKSSVEIPDDIMFYNIEESLQPLKKHLVDIKSSDARSSSCNRVLFYREGLHVIVKWTEEDNLQDWKPGWYAATVTNIDVRAELITVEYSSEPGCFYPIDVEKALEEDKLRIANVDSHEAEIYDQLIEVGSRIRIKIGKKKSKQFSLKHGWCNAEVQGYDPDDDEIVVVFDKRPKSVMTFPLSPLISKEKIELLESIF